MSTKIPLAERQELAEVLQQLPQKPGVYLMKDHSGQVLYVGKATSLRSRVRSYFRISTDERPAVHFLKKKVFEIETLITESEKSALLLENTLIKKHLPRYNVQLRDDKSYVGLRLSVQDPVPRLSPVRRPKKDGAEYFGPFPSASALQQVLRLLQKTFGVRVCRDHFFRNRTRPCIEYQIGRCLGPCVEGIVSQKDYQKAVKETRQFLRGDAQSVIRRLREKMAEFSQAENYEEAMKVRDQLEAIEITLKQQVVASHRREDEQDVYGLVRQEGFFEVYILFVRSGQVVGGQSYSLGAVLGTDSEILSSVLLQRYTSEVTAFALPAEILLPFPIENLTFLTETLEKIRSDKKRRRLRIFVPKRGEDRKLVEMAQENAQANLAKKEVQEERRRRGLEELSKKLHFSQVPERIECFDISNLQGGQAVGSMVVFSAGEADKKSYRHYKIRTVSGINDYEMLKEVLTRRFRNLETPKPDLLLVDGGKGQLKIAQTVLQDLHIEGVFLASLAKARTLAHEKGTTEERIFIPGRTNPITFKPGSQGLFLVQRIRDEAHRFAIVHHRKIRGKSTLRSSLDEIKGLGPKRRKKLLETYGSVEGIRNATVEDLCERGGLNVGLAQLVKVALSANTEAPVLL